MIRYIFLAAHGQMEDLLDLNAMDNTTINAIAEYFDISQIIFLSTMTDFITPNGVRMYSYNVYNDRKVLYRIELILILFVMKVFSDYLFFCLPTVELDFYLSGNHTRRNGCSRRCELNVHHFSSQLIGSLNIQRIHV